MAQYELNLRDYWQIVRKQRRLIVLMAVLVGGAAFGLSHLLKPEPLYEATAMVRYERSSNVSGLFLDVVAFSFTDSVASQTEVIKSYPVIAAAAKMAGLIPPETDSETIRLDPELLQVVLNLQSRVEAEREGKTNLIRVIGRAGTTEEAELLTNSVVTAYRQQSILTRNRQVADATIFIQGQVALVEEQLREAERAVEDYKVTEGIVQLSEESRSSLSMIAKAEVERDEVTRSLEEIRIQIEALERTGTLGDDPSRVDSASRIFTEPGAAQIFVLNNKLMELQQERDTLLILYQPDHPQVHELNEKILVVRNEMRRELRAKQTTYQNRLAQLDRRLDALREEYHRVPKKELHLARLAREVSINSQLYSLLKTKHQEALIKGAEKIIEVILVQPALATDAPINMVQTPLSVIVGLFIGGLLGLIMAFARESFDTSLGTIEDVELFLGLPVLGVLPEASDDVLKGVRTPGMEDRGVHQKGAEARRWMSIAWPGWPFTRNGVVGHRQGLKPQKRKKSMDRERSAADLASLYIPTSALAESYRSLRTNLLFTALGKPLQAIQLTSVGIGEGKTAIAVNLAISMAQAGKRVLIIDADLRRPAIHQIFEVDKSPGLTDLLLGLKTLPQVCRSLPDLLMGRFSVEEVMKFSAIDQLNIITSGFLPPNPSECLNSPSFDTLVREFRHEYDVILFDTPPILPVADSVVVGQKTDGTLLVYQVGDVPRLALRRAKLILEQAQVKVIGTVLNNVRPEAMMDPYQLHYRYPYFASTLSESGSEPVQSHSRSVRPSA